MSLVDIKVVVDVFGATWCHSK